MDSIIPIILGGTVLLFGGVLLLFRFLRRKTTEIEYYHFFCAGCKRKLRYRSDQVGNKGKCPRCSKQLVFPPVATQKKTKK